jgi:cytoskeleton protein RodZ
LEEDNIGKLDAPVFVRSYLVRYARLLNLSEPEILQHYRQLGLKEQPPLRMVNTIKPQAKTRDVFRWFAYLLLIALLGWLGWLGSERFLAHPENSEAVVSLARNPDKGKPLILAPSAQTEIRTPAENHNSSAVAKPTIVTDVSSAPAVAATPTEAAELSDNAVGTAQASAENAVMETTAGPEAELTDPVVQSPLDTETRAESNSATASAPTTGMSERNAKLVLELTADCWVDIKDATGEQLAYGILPANSVKILSGLAPFSVLLGNSEAVQITLNNEPIDQASYVKRGGVSRFALKLPNSAAY